MNKQLKKLIAPRWVEEQQGVYIPLIDKVLLKDNVPKMPYDDYMDYAEANNVQIATKDELLQMYRQKDETNKLLEEHNGDVLEGWFGSSSEYYSYHERIVNFGSGICTGIGKYNSTLSRAVVALKRKQNKKDMKQFSLEEYFKNPGRKVVTKNGQNVRIICTDRVGIYPIVALIGNGTEEVYIYSENGKNGSLSEELDLFFVPEKHEGWVNVYRTANGAPCTTTNVYGTKEEAEEYGCSMVATCKIEWKE